MTRFEPEQDEVNYVLASAAQAHDDVVLVDWTGAHGEGTPGAAALLAGDGLHLSATGQAGLAAMISGAWAARRRRSRASAWTRRSTTMPPARSRTVGGGGGTSGRRHRGIWHGRLRLGSRSGGRGQRPGAGGGGAATTTHRAAARRRRRRPTTPAPPRRRPRHAGAPPPRRTPPVTAGEPRRRARAGAAAPGDHGRGLTHNVVGSLRPA